MNDCFCPVTSYHSMKRNSSSLNTNKISSISNTNTNWSKLASFDEVLFADDKEDNLASSNQVSLLKFSANNW